MVVAKGQGRGEEGVAAVLMASAEEVRAQGMGAKVEVAVGMVQAVAARAPEKEQTV